MTILSKDLVIIGCKAIDGDEVISGLARLLESEGYVKDTYLKAVLDREKIYPTGLFTMPVNVAMPHTDSTHVNKSAIAIAVLDKPVKFNKMGGGADDSLDVSLVFLLAIKDPKLIMETLMKLMTVFQDKELLENLSLAKTKDEIIHYMSKLGI